MITTCAKLFSVIRSVLTDQVLTNLEASTWTAANVRASLALLTYLEDLTKNGPKVLLENNATIGAFLSSLGDRNLPWMSAPLLTRCRAALGRQARGDVTLDRLIEENWTLQSLLVDVIRARNYATGAVPDDAFDHALRVCISSTTALDFSITRNASQMPPF